MPPKADLGDLRGLSAGLDGRGSGMIDGGAFDGAKAYKDSKVGLKGGRRVEARLQGSGTCFTGMRCIVLLRAGCCSLILSVSAARFSAQFTALTSAAPLPPSFLPPTCRRW